MRTNSETGVRVILRIFKEDLVLFVLFVCLFIFFSPKVSASESVALEYIDWEGMTWHKTGDLIGMKIIQNLAKHVKGVGLLC